MSKWFQNKWIIGFSAFGAAAGFSLLSRDYLISKKKYTIKDNLEGKTFIVTGANSGIGRATTEALAAKNARVIMACRDTTSCIEARKAIVLETRNKSVVCRQCDLSSFASVQNFARRMLTEEGDNLYCLINNAAVMYPPSVRRSSIDPNNNKKRSKDWVKAITTEGIETTIGVNYFAPFLLTMLLIDPIRKRGGEFRIVNVGISDKAQLKVDNIDFNDLNFDQKLYNRDTAYVQSKLALDMFSVELARRLKRLDISDITVNIVDPGESRTNLRRHDRAARWSTSRFFLGCYDYAARRTPAQAAMGVLYAATSSELNNESGFMLLDCEKKSHALAALDQKENIRLFMTSEKWTRLFERIAELDNILQSESSSLPYSSQHQHSGFKTESSANSLVSSLWNVVGL